MNSPKLVNLGNVTIDDVVIYDGTIRMGCLGGDVIYSTAAARLYIDRIDMIAPVGSDYPEENILVVEERLNNGDTIIFHDNYVAVKYQQETKKAQISALNQELSALSEDSPEYEEILRRQG